MKWYSAVGLMVFLVLAFLSVPLTARYESNVYRDRDKNCASICSPYQVYTCNGEMLDRVPNEVWCLTAERTAERKK